MVATTGYTLSPCVGCLLALEYDNVMVATTGYTLSPCVGCFTCPII